MIEHLFPTFKQNNCRNVPRKYQKPILPLFSQNLTKVTKTTPNPDTTYPEFEESHRTQTQGENNETQKNQHNFIYSLEISLGSNEPQKISLVNSKDH